MDSTGKDMPKHPGGMVQAGFALACVLTALLSDWLSSELFMRRDSGANIAGALLTNAAILVAAFAAAWMTLAASTVLVALRTLVLIGFGAVVLSGLRAATAPGNAMGLALRLGIVALALIAALAITIRMSDVAADRLMQALALASIAFIAVPFVWRLAGQPPRAWIGPPAAAAAPTAATMFLLLDELGHDAAAPLAADLRAAGLNVRSEALAPAGDNTLNAVPKIFSGLDFARARPCGASTLCSGSNALDFSRISVGRSDVDVTGLLLPYCDIRGLRSCFQLPLPHEFGSAYRSLAVFYLRRLALPVPALLAPPPDRPALKRDLLKLQTDVIDRTRFWTDGGILYAHLPLPHPPGMLGSTTLDADYAANIEQARTLVRTWVASLSARFDDRFSIVITSDHPLRNYWCSAGVYKGAACNTRAAFQSAKIPLIVASPGPVSTRAIADNVDVFRILNDQAGSALP